MGSNKTFSLALERNGNTVTAHVGGRIDSSNAWDFDRELHGGLKSTDMVLVMDCGSLRYISSAGLRVALKLAKQFRPPQRRFVMSSLTDDIGEIVRISGFDRIIEIHDSVESALGSG